MARPEDLSLPLPEPSTASSSVQPGTDTEAAVVVRANAPKRFPPAVINVEPSDGTEIRRLTPVLFDVPDLDLVDIFVAFVHAGATELAWAGPMGFLEPYVGSVVVPIPGGHHFQIRRKGGWKTPPSLLGTNRD